MSDNLKTMLLITANWQGAPTIQLIPLISDCPYVEVIFVPQMRALMIVSKIKEHRYSMVDKLNDDGERLRSSRSTKDVPDFKKQRVLLESFHEYSILSQKEMETFIETIAQNPNGIPYVAIIDGWLKLAKEADIKKESEARPMTIVPDQPDIQKSDIQDSDEISQTEVVSER